METLNQRRDSLEEANADLQAKLDAAKVTVFPRLLKFKLC